MNCSQLQERRSDHELGKSYPVSCGCRRTSRISLRRNTGRWGTVRFSALGQALHTLDRAPSQNVAQLSSGDANLTNWDECR